MPNQNLNLKFFAALLGISLVGFQAAAQEPAPADKGLVKEGPAVTNAANKTGPGENSAPAKETVQEAGQSNLEKDIQALRGTIQKLGEAQKEVEQLRGKLAIVEGDNAALSLRVKTLEGDNEALTQRVKRLEGDNARLLEQMRDLTEPAGAGKQVTAKKPAFVKSAVEFYNYESHPVKMNVNGVWHTLKEGKNTILVPYGPVQIHRYTSADPRTFIQWTPSEDGFVMEFDVGNP